VSNRLSHSTWPKTARRNAHTGTYKLYSTVALSALSFLPHRPRQPLVQLCNSRWNLLVQYIAQKKRACISSAATSAIATWHHHDAPACAAANCGHCWSWFENPRTPQNHRTFRLGKKVHFTKVKKAWVVWSIQMTPIYQKWSQSVYFMNKEKYFMWK